MLNFVAVFCLAKLYCYFTLDGVKYNKEYIIILCGVKVDINKFVSGSYEQGYEFKSFVPAKINQSWTWSDPVINTMLEQASLLLGELNALSRFVPDVDMFIRMHVLKEAVVSSRIEGTRTGMDDASLPELEVTPEKRDDWNEVNNYVRAMNYAIERLQELPLSMRLLRETHSILLDSVRGKHKLPGEFRSSQNWIGGATIKDAVFVPPTHNLVAELLSDIEQFLHNDTANVPDLIKIAIAHYQFETVHPFLDGNGRIGRLMITLYLVSRGIMDRPLLYLSDYFENNRSLYYDNLTFARTKNDLAQWLKFFLVGVSQTAAKSVATLKKLLDLKLQLEGRIKKNLGKRSEAALLLLYQLFATPAVSIKIVAETTGLSTRAATALITALINEGILHEVTGNQRNRIFSFKDYLQMFE